ncbi:tetratricopeptide repeat protein [Kitasatospora sp. NPDC091207]|uniref:tetratricopeptide repeat protein n=1 Tax=Kitasatospora sp. NPDC091207 TaxID=3364083 RepID=UPI0037F126C2
METVDWSWADREREGVLCHGWTGDRPYAVRLPEVITPLSGPPPAELTGRDTEFAVLRTALTGDGRPCVVVTGPPGVGKSALARRTGHALQAEGHFPGGPLTIEFHGSDHVRRQRPERALGRALRAAGLPPEHIPPDPAGRAALLHRTLASYAARGRRVLLHLDDPATDDDLTALLPAPGTAGVLVTARHTPRDLPGTFHGLAPLTTAAATDLLRAELTARGARRPADAADGLDLRRLAKACGGLPPALLVTAATMARTGATAGETSRELDRLRAGPERLDGPVRTLAAVHLLALAALGTGPTRLLRLTRVLPGPDFSTDTVRDLAGPSAGTVAADLDALLAVGLLARSDAPDRWRPTLHADDDLPLPVPSGTGTPNAAADEAREALERLVRAHTERVRAACLRLSPLRRGPGTDARAFADRTAALAWLDAEHPTSAGLLRRAASAGGPDAAAGLAEALDPYLEHGLHRDELADAAALVQALAGERGDPGAELAAQVRLGRLRCLDGRPEEALALLRQAAEGARRIRHWEVAATALAALAEAWRAVGRPEEAAREGRRAAAIAARMTGDAEAEYRGSLHAGIALAEKGRAKAAAKDLSRSVRMAEAAGDQLRTGVANVQLGLVGLDLMDRALPAAALFTLAFHAFREAGDRHRRLVALGLAGRAGGDLGLSFLAEAAEGLLALGDELAGHLVLEEVGELLSDLGQHEQAAALQRAVADFRGRVDDPAGRARALTALAASLGRLERHDEAVARSTEAVTRAREAGRPAVLSAALSGLGRSLHGAGRPLEAVDPLHEAVTLAVAEDDVPAEVWALALLGSALTAAGRPTEAAAAFRRSRAAVRRIREPVHRAAVHPARPEQPAAPMVTVVEATVPPGVVPPGAAARAPRPGGRAVAPGGGGGAAREKGSHFRRASTAYAQVAVLLAVAAWAAFALGGPWATAAAAVTGVSAALAVVAALSFRDATGADVATPAQLLLQVLWRLLPVPVLLLHALSLTRGELRLTGPVPSLASLVAYLALTVLVRRAGRFGTVALGV